MQIVKTTLREREGKKKLSGKQSQRIFSKRVTRLFVKVSYNRRTDQFTRSLMYESTGFGTDYAVTLSYFSSSSSLSPAFFAKSLSGYFWMISV